jgi:ketosteroid isomerase-like protein
MDLEATVQLLRDKDEIRETLLRYASTIDVKDWDGLRSVFTEDAVVRLVDEQPKQGVDEILGYVQHRTRRRLWQHHLLSVYHIDVRGDEADALTYHTSHQTTDGKPDTVLVLVCRYHDRLRREADGWRISEKVMRLGWHEERPRTSGGDLMEP